MVLVVQNFGPKFRFFLVDSTKLLVVPTSGFLTLGPYTVLDPSKVTKAAERMVEIGYLIDDDIHDIFITNVQNIKNETLIEAKRKADLYKENEFIELTDIYSTEFRKFSLYAFSKMQISFHVNPILISPHRLHRCW